MRSHCLSIPLVLLVALTGCTADGEEDLGADGGSMSADATQGCAIVPDLQPAWLMDFQDEVVAKLSGGQEIAPGVVLGDRATTMGRGRAQVYIEEQLSGMGYQPQRHDYGNGTNVFVELEGSGDSVYVLGAHYDSVADSPGANDNATGVAAVLSAARFLREHECRVHNVVFVLFDQEELGLIGSAAFAQKLQFDGRDVRGVYTLDQLGWDMDQDRRLEIEIPGPGMFDQVQTSIAKHDLAVPLAQTTTAGSDHSAFRQAGFPALGITEEYVNGDTTPHYHLDSDTYATVDFGFLASATAVVHALIFDLSTGS
jgi:hypothetical protein